MFNTDSLKITHGTNPLLRQKAKAITSPGDPNLHFLIQQMIKTLKHNNGIGLAAPQIGESIRLFIIEVDYNLYVMINPELKNPSKDKVVMEEGCLSFPGLFKPVERSKKITVTYYDEEGKKQRLKAKGMLARAIQHEYDHLEGVLFIDYQ